MEPGLTVLTVPAFSAITTPSLMRAGAELRTRFTPCSVFSLGGRGGGDSAGGKFVSVLKNSSDRMLPSRVRLGLSFRIDNTSTD